MGPGVPGGQVIQNILSVIISVNCLFTLNPNLGLYPTVTQVPLNHHHTSTGIRTVHMTHAIKQRFETAGLDWSCVISGPSEDSFECLLLMFPHV